MSIPEPPSAQPERRGVPRAVLRFNDAVAYAMTAPAMFGVLGLVLGTFGIDYEFAAMLLRVTAAALTVFAAVYAVPVGVWAVRARIRGTLPRLRLWAAPIGCAALLVTPIVLPLLLPLTPIFAVCLIASVASIIVIRFGTAADGRGAEA